MKFQDVRGKSAIITGAARGLGFECARTLAEAGVDVVIADVLPDIFQSWDKIKAEYPDNKGYAVQMDVTDEAAVKALVEGAVERLGKLDIMCNNAGLHGGVVDVTDADVQLVQKVLTVNFGGVFLGSKYACAVMKKQGFGTIINTGSFYGKVGHAGSAIYGASKGAVHTFTQALAMEMAPYGVTVNAVCPAIAATEMHWEFVRRDAAAMGISFEQLKQDELKDMPLGRLGTGRDSAGAVLWLASEAGSYVTGQLINVNGGVCFV